MKLRHVLVGVLALSISTVAAASPPGDTPPAGGDAPEALAPDGVDPRLKARFDLDHDGVLSPEERWVAKHAMRRHRMKRHDRGDVPRDDGLRGDGPRDDRMRGDGMRGDRMRGDGPRDGQIGPRQRAAAMRARKFDRAIRRFDRDGDGVLGPGEAPPRLVHKLRRLDRNGDGWLTRDEIVRPPLAR